jgi:hypothetical protein
MLLPQPSLLNVCVWNAAAGLAELDLTPEEQKPTLPSSAIWAKSMGEWPNNPKQHGYAGLVSLFPAAPATPQARSAVFPLCNNKIKGMDTGREPVSLPVE